MEIQFKQVRVPALSLLCVIVLMGLLLYLSTKIYYRYDIPIHFVDVNENIVTYLSTNLQKGIINQNYNELSILINSKIISVQYLGVEHANKDSIYLHFKINSNIDLKEFLPYSVIDRKDTLLIINTLYNYILTNIVNR